MALKVPIIMLPIIAVSGTQALIEAYHAIKSGQLARAVVVAYDVGSEPQALFYYNKLGLISRSGLKTV